MSLGLELCVSTLRYSVRNQHREIEEERNRRKWGILKYLSFLFFNFVLGFSFYACSTVQGSRCTVATYALARDYLSYIYTTNSVWHKALLLHLYKGFSHVVLNHPKTCGIIIYLFFDNTTFQRWNWESYIHTIPEAHTIYIYWIYYAKWLIKNIIIDNII